MSVQEIKEAIKQVTPKELEELEEFIAQARFEAWDEQIKADSEAGHLNKVLAQARASYRRGEGTPL